jgi:D-aminopeptidase
LKKPRARELGIPCEGKAGPCNAITDVAGLTVGHVTLIEGDGPLHVGRGPVRTGVTVILPRGMDYDPVFAGWSVLNGCGEMTGTIWVEESGLLEGPVAITNTHSVGTVRDAIVAWLYERGQHDRGMVFAIPVVAETYDGWLNDINGFHVKTEHVFRALDEAASGPVAEGNVGGGTGMICHQFKGGIGASSRLVSAAGREYTLGVLVQANYGRREHLTIAGVPVGREITDLMPETRPVDPRPGSGSIIGVLATDAPLLPHQLKRLARRLPLGLARVGGQGGNTSGDIFLAFSTANPGAGKREGHAALTMLSNDEMNPLFGAAIQATEESIVNALLAAETMTGINGNTVHALPHDRLMDAMRKYGRG